MSLQMPGSSSEAETREPTVSLILPIGGRPDGVQRCLASVADLQPPPDETIVVLDGIDLQIDSLGGLVGLKVVTLDTSGGPAAARNAGAQESRSDVLLFVDADVELHSSLVSRVVSIFVEQPEWAAVIGSYDDEPAAPQAVSRFRNLLHHYVHQCGRSEAFSFWGACGAIRREVFESLGGFDESFRLPSIEDIELGARVIRMGHRIRLVKDLQVKHLKRWTLRSMVSTDFFRRAVPWTELMLRSGGLVNDLNVDRTNRMSVVLVGLLLVALLGALLWPLSALGAVVAAGALVFLNLSLYRFFRQKLGFGFAIVSAGLHWLHLLVGGIGFAIGAVRALLFHRKAA